MFSYCFSISWVPSVDRLSTMIAEINLNKRVVQLSIKLLEEAENKLAIKKYGSTTSGKSLPFADLPSALKEKKEKKEKKK